MKKQKISKLQTENLEKIFKYTYEVLVCAYFILKMFGYYCPTLGKEKVKRESLLAKRTG